MTSAHIPLIDPEAGPPEAVDVLAEIAASRGAVPNLFRAMATSPELTGAVGRLGGHVRFSSSLEADELELVILTVARELGCTYEWTHHLAAAAKAGLTEEDARRALDQPEGERLPIMLESARTLARGQDLDEDHVTRLRSAIGDRGAVDLIVSVGYYQLIGRFLNAMAVPLEDGVTPAPF